MTGYRTLGALLCRLWLAACSCFLCANLALAGVQDSRFEFSADGTSVDFDVRDTSRREVLNQLFAGTDIAIQFTNAAFGDQRISGKFSGTPTAVLQQLLAQSNFVIVHDDTSRVVRVIIDGPTRREQSSAGLAALGATITPPQPGAIAGAQAQQESASGAGLSTPLASALGRTGMGGNAVESPGGGGMSSGAFGTSRGAVSPSGAGLSTPLASALGRTGMGGNAVGSPGGGMGGGAFGISRGAVSPSGAGLSTPFASALGRAGMGGNAVQSPGGGAFGISRGAVSPSGAGLSTPFASALGRAGMGGNAVQSPGGGAFGISRGAVSPSGAGLSTPFASALGRAGMGGNAVQSPGGGAFGISRGAVSPSGAGLGTPLASALGRTGMRGSAVESPGGGMSGGAFDTSRSALFSGAEVQQESAAAESSGGGISGGASAPFVSAQAQQALPGDSSWKREGFLLDDSGFALLDDRGGRLLAQ
jgi:hypothetical protein